MYILAQMQMRKRPNRDIITEPTINLRLNIFSHTTDFSIRPLSSSIFCPSRVWPWRCVMACPTVNWLWPLLCWWTWLEEPPCWWGSSLHWRSEGRTSETYWSTLVWNHWCIVGCGSSGIDLVPLLVSVGDLTRAPQGLCWCWRPWLDGCCGTAGTSKGSRPGRSWDTSAAPSTGWLATSAARCARTGASIDPTQGRPDFLLLPVLTGVTFQHFRNAKRPFDRFYFYTSGLVEFQCLFSQIKTNS